MPHSKYDQIVDMGRQIGAWNLKYDRFPDFRRWLSMLGLTQEQYEAAIEYLDEVARRRSDSYFGLTPTFDPGPQNRLREAFMHKNPYDPIAELAKRTKQKRARQALRKSGTKQKVAAEMQRKRRAAALRAINPSEQGHASWASYNEGMSDAEMAKFESGGSPLDLLNAFKYAYGSQINYLDAAMPVDADRMRDRVEMLERRLMDMMGYEPG